ncbi:MAG: hypothetical protein K2Y37_20885 [Pirellulales bacterium]|nr:hypothetical protein [Pirellulales bacterium]
MSGEALRRLIHSRERGNGIGPPGGDDDDENFAAPAFGFLRGIKDRASFFEIRHRDGKVTAFTYSWLDQAEFDPSDASITLHFGRNKVKLCGRNLNSEIRPNVTLFGSILRGKVPWVSESGQADMLTVGREDVVIERVMIQ